jgi:hypothetical protein
VLLRIGEIVILFCASEAWSGRYLKHSVLAEHNQPAARENPLIVEEQEGVKLFVAFRLALNWKLHSAGKIAGGPSTQMFARVTPPAKSNS